MSGVSPAPIGTQIATIPYGAVGSIIFAGRPGLGFSEGDIVAGSSIYPATAMNNLITADSYLSSNISTRGAAALSGSWRAMCRSQFDAASTTRTRIGIFVRIA